MIAGATRGQGGRGLAVHLADLRRSGRINDSVVPGASRGLVSSGIAEQLREVTALASHAVSARPLYHVHADPPAGVEFDGGAWERYWRRFEREFGLEGQAFTEAVHTKGGRAHCHRVYSLVKPDGSCVRLDHDHARREKICRITEVEEGMPLTKGAHNRAVIAALLREGRDDIAEAIAELADDGPRPRAPTTPAERAQQQRTGISKRGVQAAVWQAWTASDTGPAFLVALEASGLRLALGDKVPVVVDASGNSHPVARLIGAAAKAAAGERISATLIHDRIRGLDLMPVTEVRSAAMVEPTTSNNDIANTIKEAPAHDQTGPDKTTAPGADEIATIPGGDANSCPQHQDRHGPDSRDSDGAGRGAEPDGSDHPAPDRDGPGPAADDDRARRHRCETRRLDAGLKPRQADLSKLISTASQEARPADVGAFLRHLKTSAAELRRRAAAITPPRHGHLVACDLDRRRAIEAMHAAEQVLADLPEEPPGDSLLDFLFRRWLWYFRHRAAIKALGQAEARATVAVDAAHAKARAIVTKAEARVAPLLREAVVCETIAKAIEAGGVETIRAIRWCMGRTAIETAAERDLDNQVAAIQVKVDEALFTRRRIANLSNTPNPEPKGPRPPW